ncbi:MAG: hypothetical protein CMI54_02520 [Parcubacteria group bacterium]|nr:hypothetical protein [Parcubacteria group bacterium]
MLKKLFCKHKWKPIQREIVPSQIERMKDIIDEFENIPRSFFTSTSITILQCDKCGKLNKTIVEV